MSAMYSSSMVCFQSLLARVVLKLTGSSLEQERHQRTVPSVYFLGFVIPRDARVVGGASTGSAAVEDPGKSWVGAEDPGNTVRPEEAAAPCIEDPGWEGAGELDPPVGVASGGGARGSYRRVGLGSVARGCYGLLRRPVSRGRLLL